MVAPGHFSAGSRQRIGLHPRRWEFDERAITQELDDPAMVFFNGGIDQFPAAGFQPLQRTGLVHPHEAAIADHVSRKVSLRDASPFLCHPFDAGELGILHDAEERARAGTAARSFTA